MKQNLDRIKSADYVALAKRLLAKAKKLWSDSVEFETTRVKDMGTFLGVPVQIRPSFLLLLTLFGLGWGPAGIPAVFLGLLLHEFSHVRVAKRLGLEARSVTFNALGGAAAIEMDGPFFTRPRAEWQIALAGPASSVALATVGWFGATLCLIAGIPSKALLVFGQVNLLLGLFNLAPVLPLDGGRIVRGLLLDGKTRPQEQHAVIHGWLKTVSINYCLAGSFLFIFPAITIAILVLHPTVHDRMLEETSEYFRARCAQELPPPTAYKPRDGWWRVLGLDREPSDLKTVKRAYRQMVLLHHPDKGGSEADMKRITRAYADGKMILG